jgi:amidase
MLEEAGAIVDESARPAFSFEEAWEVFAVLTHALIGADKLTALELRFFDLRSLSSRSASARDAPEHGGFHRHSGARFFEHIDVMLCQTPAPTGPIRLFRPDAVGLSRHWRRFAGRRGSGDAWSGWLAARRQIIAASFEDRTAIACAAMLEALGARFRAPPMTSP